MSKKPGFRCKIEDWYGIHKGFMLTLRPGYTALVGPNGAGKTTLLHQLAEIGKKRGYNIIQYSNLTDGGDVAMSEHMWRGDVANFFAGMQSSEGERIALNFGNVLQKIGTAVRKAIAENRPLLILLDALDSGASIDRLRETLGVFELIERDAGVEPGASEHEIYIVAAVNSYELAKRRCVDARTGKSLTFGDYEDYSRFICRYFAKREEDEKNHKKSDI